MRRAIVQAIRAATFETTVCYLWNYNPVLASKATQSLTTQQVISPEGLSIPTLLLMMTSIIVFTVLMWIANASNEKKGVVEAFRLRDLGLTKRIFKSRRRRRPSSALSTDSNSITGSTSGGSTSSSTFWDDLVPPFFNDRGGIDGFDDDDFFHGSSSSLFDDSDFEEDDKYSDGAIADVTHFCFLIHGHRGLSKDLRYMQTVMQRWARAEKRRQWEQQQNDPTLHIKHDMVLHNAVCNEYKTTDGIENGGDRLVAEMREVIEAEMERRINQRKELQQSTSTNGMFTGDDEGNDDGLFDITLSVVGNSLGGLFARYAIAKLLEHCTEEETIESNEEHPTWILDGKYRLHFNMFCTTATPHLGVSGHTYLPLPRTAEIGVAHAMGDTGKDLFRLNDLIRTMATCKSYLRPLSRFRKRIAYANAYGTDFPVPAATAAFLSENSTYPHFFIEPDTNDNDDTVVVDDNGLIIATLHTPNHNEVVNTYEDLLHQHQHEDELHHMSMSLDRLGWKKVFIDMRREIPSVELPQVVMTRARRRRTTDLSSESDTSGDDSESSMTTNTNCLQSLQPKGVVGSRDIASAVNVPADDNRLFIPLGHNMIVAFSRSKRSSFMNKAGRPIVDALAKELVEDIFKWEDRQ